MTLHRDEDARRRGPILLLLLTLVGHGLFFQEVPYDNVMVRLGLVWAIAEEGVLHIDTFADRSADKSFYDGHFYSDKAPGVSFLGVPIYLGWKAVRSVFGATWDLDVYRYVARFFILSLPTALCAILLFRLMTAWSGRPREALVWAAAFVVATPAFPYATVLYGHQLAGVCCFGGWWMFRSPRVRGSIPLTVVAGCIMGFAWFAQYPAAVLVAVLWFGAVWLYWEEKPAVAWLAVGIGLTIVAMGVYNWACFDSPFRISYAYKHNPAFQEVHGQGFFGISLPRVDATWTLLFSPNKGLFFFSPFLLGSFWGAWRFLRRAQPNREAVVFLGASVLYMAMFCSFVDYEAGYSFGPRHMIPMLPFLVALLAGLAPQSPLQKGILGGLVLYGASVFLLGTGTCLHVPFELNHPLASYFVPLAVHGYSSSILSVLGWLPPQVGLVVAMGVVLAGLVGIIARALGATAAVVASGVPIALWGGILAAEIVTPQPPEYELILGDIAGYNELDETAVHFWRQSPLREQALLKEANYFSSLGDDPVLAGRAFLELFRHTADDQYLVQGVAALSRGGAYGDAIAAIPEDRFVHARWRFIRGTLLMAKGSSLEAAQDLADPEVQKLPRPEKEALRGQFLGQP